MEIVTDPLFWGEVGLAVASKLALLAAVLWVARMAISAHTPAATDGASDRALRGDRTGVRDVVLEATPSVRTPATPDRVSTGYTNLRRAPERDERTALPPDQMRQRLLEFVERRSAERTRP